MSGTSGRRGRTSVSGPGQKRAASEPIRGSSAARHAVSAAASARWTISGSKDGPRLHLEDARHGARVEGVGAEAVDGLGGEGHEPARARSTAAASRDGRGVGRGEDARAHAGGGAGGSWASPPRAREASMPQAASMSGPPGVAADEAEAVRGERREEAAALLVARAGEAPRRGR